MRDAKKDEIIEQKNMNTSLLSSFFLVLSCLLVFPNLSATAKNDSKGLEIGYAISITNVTPEAMHYAKSVGVSSIEIGFGALVDKSTREFTISDEALMERMTNAKKAADDAGINIGSIHMPFGEHIDLSLSNEEDRKDVVIFQKKLLGFLKILKPEVILFHPSWHLGRNERETRKKQFIKSATELDKVVRKMKATMVIENMLGPKLVLSATRERALCRTVEETVEIMNRLPKTIYSAIDMNHIKQPEKLILAMGSRLKSVHVADGDGLAERHYFPCSGQGENDWTAILAALDEVNYQGPFMFESAHKDVKDLKECYDELHAEYIKAKRQ